MKNGNCKVELFFLVAKVVNVQEMDNAEQKGIFLFFFFFLNQVTPDSILRSHLFYWGLHFRTMKGNYLM